MLKVRKDSKKRVLKIGESQRKDGRYVYKYVDNLKKVRFVYSWKLLPGDKTPPGKREDLSLREKEKQIIRDIADEIDTSGKNITVKELYLKQINQNQNVKPNTIAGRNHLLKIIDQDKFGNRHLDKVKMIDAKEWIIRQKEKGLSFKTIKNYKRSLSSAFEMAVQNDFVRKNPFKFNIKDVISDNSKEKTALTVSQQKQFLSAIKNDEVYSKNYHEFVILLGTGLRASEFCGLTKNDVDMKNKVISVNHQLLKNSSLGYYIAPPKTKCSVRSIYMSESVYNAFKNIITELNSNHTEIQGYKDFLFLDKNQNPKTVASIDAMFRRVNRKYNISVTPITPHTLRHTFCTNMANAGMNPKALQYIMGHSDIAMTLNYYSHTSFDVAKKEMKRILG